MRAIRLNLQIVVLSISSCILPASFALPVSQQQSHEGPQQNAGNKRIGTIKAINGNVLALTLDSGADVSITVQASTRLVRIAPRDTNLKNATPIQVQDLQVGDRILVAGKASEDAKSIAASSVVVMKRSDVEARHQEELQDWQKRGLGGLVSAVDAASGTVTISLTTFGGIKQVAIHTAKNTVIRRYAPGSVKFDDAKPSSLTEVQPGDQLRARGNRSADGTELAADEIVAGSFRNLAGIINSVDSSAGTITVQDLLGKKPAQVKITQDSQLRKLPPEMAQAIAARLKGAVATPGSDARVSTGTTALGASSPKSAASPAGDESAKSRTRSGGAPDFQQMLSRMPAMAVSDLHKGDAVMIVASEGELSGPGTAITVLSGVEPILQAAPSANQAMILSPWSLGGAPSGDTNQ